MHSVDDKLLAAVASELLGVLEPGWMDDPNLKDTPERVARMYAEMLGGHEFSPTTFPNDEHFDQIVLLKDIPFTSLCAHHMIPFSGVAAVAYIPNTKLIGLSKLARLVEHYARRLQLQESLTQQIGKWIERELGPIATGVIIEAEHFCITGRGVRKPGIITKTSYLSGAFRDKQASREELMFLLQSGG